MLLIETTNYLITNMLKAIPPINNEVIAFLFAFILKFPKNSKAF